MRTGNRVTRGKGYLARQGVIVGSLPPQAPPAHLPIHTIDNHDGQAGAVLQGVTVVAGLMVAAFTVKLLRAEGNLRQGSAQQPVAPAGEEVLHADSREGAAFLE